MQENSLKKGLYVVGTPIGNLSDFSERAIHVLKSVDFVACEDTRVSGKLFSKFDIKTKRVSMHEHNEKEVLDKMILELKNDKTIAVISDAGMPLISDPGFILVREARKQNIPVYVVPGPTAVISALVLSGFPTDKFYFGGFLPATEMARDKTIHDSRKIKPTLIFYESPKRLEKSLQSFAKIMPERKIAVVREITKIYEETKIDWPAGLINYYSENGWPKGEIVLVVDYAQETQMSDDDIKSIIDNILENNNLSSKDKASEIAKQTNISKKTAYDIVLNKK